MIRNKRAIYIRKILAMALAICFTVAAWGATKGTTVPEYISRAKECYEAGDTKGAIAALDSAKRLINKEAGTKDTKKDKNSEEEEDVIKLKKWSTVQRNPSKYEGKKVTIKAKNKGITPDGSLWIYGISPMCPYEESIREDILGLDNDGEYTFYGVVEYLNDTIGAVLHVESVE